MTHRWPNDRNWDRTTSTSWKHTRLGRSRRPLFLALCCVLFIFWLQSTPSNLSQSSISARQESPSQTLSQSRSPRNTLVTEKVSNQRPHNDPTESERLQGKRIREDHLEQDQLEEIRTIEKHLRDSHHGPGYSSGAHQAALSQEDESEDDVPGELKAIEKHLQEEHAEHRQAELQQDAAFLRKDPFAPAERPVAEDSDQKEEPVSQIPKLDPETQADHMISSPTELTDKIVIETESQEHLSLEEKADLLPDIVHIPFEDAVRDVVLEGWEDEWISNGVFDHQKWGKLEEPRIDFVFLWVNGSDKDFQDAKRPYELNSVLNDVEGKWISSHGTNRYRDWDELRYSVRSIEKHAGDFRNKIQILVNSLNGVEDGKQIPWWLNAEPYTSKTIQVLAQEEFFDKDKHVCLPTFNSLTIENQIFNTPSDVDQLFALSDDMLLGKKHAASDIYSPLFGPVMGFKTNGYSTTSPPTEVDAHRFGEKPFLIYTSWLLNQRFGVRKRKGQGHFGHSLSRSVTREAIGSFPGPELESACKRFRGEPGFQLYSWYATFHYTIERQREALLWSYIMLRSDVDSDENLSWPERQVIMSELEAGMRNEGRSSFRKRNFYHVAAILERAGLQAPKVNTDIQWTSLDGPAAIREADCTEFDVNECLAPGFSTATSDAKTRNPIFSSALIFDRVARQMPHCGDCLLKLLLNQVSKGLSPLLPHADTQAAQREVVVKAAMRYRYTIINPDALFVMVTDAEQVDSTLVSKFVRGKKELAGQLCLNDDVATDNEEELQDVMQAMTELYQGLFPEKSVFEI